MRGIIFLNVPESGPKASIQMDVNDPKPPLKEEEHLWWCKQTVQKVQDPGLWVYHPAMKKILRIATMEVKSETQDTSWLHLNKVLNEVNKQPYFQLSPKTWKVDENGANFCGIKGAYEEQVCF